MAGWGRDIIAPAATYRIQFNARFGFKEAIEIIRYLKTLGVTDLYASPLFTAGAASTHGYDVCSFRELDPKLGGSDGFGAFVGHLRSEGLELLMDFVPNHMRADIANPWWLDVLEKGPSSPYALYFDIDWDSDRPQVFRKVLLPVLGSLYAEALEKGEIRLLVAGSSLGSSGTSPSQDNTALWVEYYSHRFPASWPTYVEILRAFCRELSSEQALEAEAIAAGKLLERCSSAVGAREVEELKREWNQLLNGSDSSRVLADSVIARINGTPGDPRSFDSLDRLLQAQHYRLCWWRTGPEQIDYRRFFDITELVCLNMQRPEVFESVHGVLRTLIERGIVHGVRVDHPDGLWDPLEYFSRLLNLWPGNLPRTARYIVAEKILSGHEQLPRSWPVAGTTGYEFLNQLNGLFVASANKERFTALYKEFTGRAKPFGRVLVESRLKVLRQSFPGQFELLLEGVLNVASQTRYGRDLPSKSIRSALAQVIAAFPVYRTYVTERTRTISLQERRAVERACRSAARRIPSQEAMALGFIRQILLLEFPLDFDATARELALHVIMKFQQLTAPLAAKGMEDTACYVYNRLISLNEVGGNPDQFGISVADFHRANASRARHWPRTLLATSTHDTKRGEDTRARINVLSELPQEWAQALQRWKTANNASKTLLEVTPAPHPNTEYFLYQTLLGTWLFDSSAPTIPSTEYLQRIQDYMLKSIREAKEQTSWTDQNAPYEDATKNFIHKILTPDQSNSFLPDLDQFVRKIAFFGYLNSLAQLLLKACSPGIPDFYQGSELWDFSLVDPDNRREIDFAYRADMLSSFPASSAGNGDMAKEDLTAPADLLPDLLADFHSGRIKLFVTWKLMQLRNAHRNLFEQGQYIPATVVGSGAQHVCAFCRVRSSGCILAVAPRLSCTLMAGQEKLPVGPDVWGDTMLTWPAANIRPGLRDLFTNRPISPDRIDQATAVFRLSEILSKFPVALLYSQ